MLNTKCLNIESYRETWKLENLEFDNELKAKLKGSIRRGQKAQGGSIVLVSYGDTIDHIYSVEESRWINEHLVVKTSDDVTFSSSEQSSEDVTFGATTDSECIDPNNIDFEEDNINDEGIKLDDI